MFYTKKDEWVIRHIIVIILFIKMICYECYCIYIVYQNDRNKSIIILTVFIQKTNCVSSIENVYINQYIG